MPYGSDAAALPSLSRTTGLVSATTVSDWNGASTTINDAVSLASLTRNAGENAASYAITNGTLALTGTLNGVNNPAVAGNYTTSFSTTGSQLTINPVALSFALTTPSQTKVYGANDPAIGGIGLTLTGLVNNPAISTWNGLASVNDSAVTGTLTGLTRTAGENVGTYAALTGAVTLSASNGNYAKSFDTTNSPQLSITQNALSVTANAQSKTYGAADPALTYNVAALVNGSVNDWNGNSTAINDTVASTFSGALARAAGESVAGSPYAISQGTLAANANYNITSFIGSNLTITTASLTVTADNQTRPEATPNPPFSVTYSGFQFGDNAASLGGTLMVATPANIASPAGLYPITPSGLTSGNYTIAFVNGVLTVTTGTVTPPVSPLPVSIPAAEGAIASTINPPGAAPTSLTPPPSPDFVDTLAPTAGGPSV